MDIFLETIRKYAPAICMNLYPSQTKELKRALRNYQEGIETYFYDAFVRLAYEMIIADLQWQEEQTGRIAVDSDNARPDATK